jgi:uncharacterized protein (TIGR03067 family)
MRIAFVLFVLLAPAALADNKSELKSLAGKWQVSDAEIDGKKVTETFKDVVLTIENGNYTVKLGPTEDKGTVTIDASKKPKTMDVTGTEGVNRGKTFPCLYEMKDDTLTICYGLDFATRPAELKTAEKSNRLLIVYKRKK